MKGLTLTTREQNRLQTLNGVLEKHWPMREAAKVMGVSERQGWRILAAYRKESAAALAHGNRGRTPANVTPLDIREQAVTLARERYSGVFKRGVSPSFLNILPLPLVKGKGDTGG